MDKSSLIAYLLQKPYTVESFPFGDDVHVFKVKNNMFALLGWHNDLMMLNLKCDPDESLALQDIFPSITAGYHMSKKHWISVYFEGSVPNNEIERLIDNSFLLVVNNMPLKGKKSILLHL